MCRRISGGGGGSGSSWFRRITSSVGLIIGGGGGSSGLGIRSMGFLGGRSGTQSSRAMIGPMIIGPRRSLDSCCRCCTILSRIDEYSDAEEVLKRLKKSN